MSELDLHSILTSGLDRIEKQLSTMRKEQREDTKEIWEAMRQDRVRCDQRHSEVNKQLDGACNNIARINGARKSKGDIDYLFWGKVTGLMVLGQAIIMLAAFIVKLMYQVV